MSFLNFILRRASDPGRIYLRELRRLNIDWENFRDKAMITLKLLHVDVPCYEFRISPGPESLVEVANRLLEREEQLAIDWRQVMNLAGVEASLVKVIRDSLKRAKRRRDFIFLELALLNWATEISKETPASGSRWSWHVWVSAYLSSRLGYEKVMPIETAIKDMATRLGWTELGLSRDFKKE